MKNTIHFYKHEYSPSHWAIDFTRAGTSIAVITVRDKFHFSVILNPTDCQGYRSIIRYLNEDNDSISSAFNRSYTLSEQRAINDVTAIMTKVYEKIGVIAQFSQLGNNSHQFDSRSRITRVGSDMEPSLLHLHMWGRGDPDMEYIQGVPLRGPKPGLMFDLTSKRKHDPSELRKCLVTFKKLLAEYVKSPEFIEEFGDSIKVSFEAPKMKAKQDNEKKVTGPEFFSSDMKPDMSASAPFSSTPVEYVTPAHK